MSDVQKIFDFTTYLEGFKKLERFVGQVFWRDYPGPKRYESTADHTWRMAMILTVVEKRLSQPIDFAKSMKMVLIHDIPELIAGDLSPLGSDGTGNDSHAYNTVAREQKSEREKAAAEIIFNKLPEPEAKELYTLWLEIEAQTSFEARLVKAIDKFEGKLQAVEYTGNAFFKEHYDFTRKYGVETWDVDPILKELGETLLKDMETNFVEFKG